MSTCTFETPGLRGADPVIPCKLTALEGSTLCEHHTWAVRKKKAEQRLSLARSAASEHEAANAAAAACTFMAEHQLVFQPKTPMIERAVKIYLGATSDEEKRKAALGVARASVGSQVVTHAERELRIASEAASRAQPAAAAPPRDPRQQAAETLGEAMDWMQAAVAVASDVINGVETRDGKPIAERAAKIQREWRAVDQRMQEFGQAILGEPVSRRARSKTKAKPKPKASKTSTRAKRG